MLTGPFSPFVEVTSRGEAHLELNAFRRKHDCALVISGDSLEVRLVLPQTCVSVLLPGGEAAPTPRPVCLSVLLLEVRLHLPLDLSVCLSSLEVRLILPLDLSVCPSPWR